MSTKLSYALRVLVLVCKLTPSTHAYACTGKAAWYGTPRLQGHKMANGQPFDRNKNTAASRTLPLGTKIRVFNLKTGRSVVVTITDRGPFTPGRILDLAWAPAHTIGCTTTGVCTVKYEIVEVP
jgi:rare lipoprotein A